MTLLQKLTGFILFIFMFKHQSLSLILIQGKSCQGVYILLFIIDAPDMLAI